MKRNLDNLRCQLEDTTVIGRDPTTIISFLTEFSDTCDELELSEQEAYMALSRFIVGGAFVHFRTAVESSSGSGSTISSWPAAVAYLLKRYAANQAIAEALQNLGAITQQPSETEEQYHLRFVQQPARAGYPFDTNERMTCFIDGLDPRLRPAIHIYRKRAKLTQETRWTCKTLWSVRTWREKHFEQSQLPETRPRRTSNRK